MFRYSRYVLCNQSTIPTLYCTVQNISLPINASRELLTQNRMIHGQEKDALDYRFANPKATKITIVPTWGCNLRCKHCVVIKELKNEPESNLDINQTITFLKQYNTEPKTITLVGGEPLLRPDLIQELMTGLDGWRFLITTNLTLPLTDDIIKLLDKALGIMVSIDGLPENHNKQRIPLVKSGDLFGQTVNNLKTLIKHVDRRKISIQAAVETLNQEDRLAFEHFFVNLGIDQKHINYGVIHPHPRNNSGSTNYTKVFEEPELFKSPCCRYQPGAQCMILPDNTVVSDFYLRDKLGTIWDSKEEITKRHMELLYRTMPALNDENCKSCEVIGYCWGQCSNSEALTKGKPSDYCNRDKLKLKVHNLAIKGKLFRG